MFICTVSEFAQQTVHAYGQNFPFPLCKTSGITQYFLWRWYLHSTHLGTYLKVVDSSLFPKQASKYLPTIEQCLTVI